MSKHVGTRASVSYFSFGGTPTKTSTPSLPLEAFQTHTRDERGHVNQTFFLPLSLDRFWGSDLTLTTIFLGIVSKSFAWYLVTTERPSRSNQNLSSLLIPRHRYCTYLHDSRQQGPSRKTYSYLPAPLCTLHLFPLDHFKGL